MPLIDLHRHLPHLTASLTPGQDLDGNPHPAHQFTHDARTAFLLFLTLFTAIILFHLLASA